MSPSTYLSFLYICDLEVISDFIYKRDHTITLYLSNISLGITPARSIYITANVRISFIFMDE